MRHLFEDTFGGVVENVNTVHVSAADNEQLRPVLNVVSDAICPWCYVGKRQLERALALLSPEGIFFAVCWRPFELNPQMPKAGLNRREYRSAKFGSWERSQALDAQVAVAGSQVGIGFRHDLMVRTPNTFDAHLLIWMAGREGMQDAVVEALFIAYFVKGQDIGDREVLADVAASSGLDRDHVLQSLSTQAGASEIKAELQETARNGLSGVPSFQVDGQVLFSGAQRAELMARTLRTAFQQATRGAASHARS